MLKYIPPYLDKSNPFYSQFKNTMTREQHKINRLLRQVKSRVERIEAMMAEIEVNEPNKIAIRSNNENEFKLLMRHFDKKGWVSKSQTKPGNVFFTISSKIVEYNNSFCFLEIGCHEGFDPKQRGYSVVDFSEWSKDITGIMPLLTTIDGVDLYEGDDHHVVYYARGDWGYACSQKLDPSHNVLSNPKEFKAFKSKEAAEKWIEEQNKPKEVTVQLFNEYHSAKITKEWIAIRVGKYDSNTTTMFKPSDLEDMLHAYKSLQ